MIELGILLLLILLALSAFFSGSEVALISMDRLTLRKLSNQKVKGIAILRRVRRKPQKMLTTLLIGNNIVNILLSSLNTIICIELFGSIGFGIAVGITTFFILVFGEIFPKSYSEANREKIALFSAPIILILSKIFHPIILLFDSISAFLFKYIFKFKPKNRQITDKDIVALVELGVEEQTIHPKEKETIEKLLKFDEVSIKDILIPKKDMICVSSENTVEKILPLIDKSGYSRYPVYDKRKSNIIGIVHIKEILRAIEENRSKDKIKYLTINAIHIPSDEKINKTLIKLQKTRVHMAFVVNKKNFVIGLITFEDLLEEIFGEIEDEEDVVKALNLVKV
ncbi:MAG: hemolysin family protein [Candidatus ainarchaeum sp.]|nr:hemolysin family protein [Candidatus ainarchaeum sp.]